MYFCNTCKQKHEIGEICSRPINKTADFEDYLMDVFHRGDGATCLDDDMPDAFNEWVVDVEIDDIIKYANEYANKLINKGG